MNQPNHTSIYSRPADEASTSAVTTVALGMFAQLFACLNATILSRFCMPLLFELKAFSPPTSRSSLCQLLCQLLLLSVRYRPIGNRPTPDIFALHTHSMV